MDGRNIQKVIFVLVVCFFGYLAWTWYASYTIQEVHVPTFSQGMCYIRNGIREPWNINPDGIIVMKGYQKYLVMPAHEADRVSGGDKIGAEEDIEIFDSKYHESTCPVNWKRHAHGKH